MDEAAPGLYDFNPQTSKPVTSVSLDCKDEIHKENQLVQTILAKLGDYDYDGVDDDV